MISALTTARRSAFLFLAVFLFSSQILFAAQETAKPHGSETAPQHEDAHTAEHGQAVHNDDDYVAHHINDANTIELPFVEIHLPHLELFGFDISITRHVVMMWLVALVLLVVLISIGNAYKTMNASEAPKGLGNLVEVFVDFIRLDIAKSNIGHGYERFVPYLLTTFFFILLCNLLGLIPYGSTATSNINVTFTLAVFTFFVTQFASVRANGVGGWLAHLTGGTPWPMWPIMIPVEIIGLFTKPFALMIRLFANMTAGHIIILSLIGLIFTMKLVIAPVSVAFSLFIYILELAVAFIQAYIFTLLSSIFIGLAASHEDDSHAAAH
ncbi:MAG: F0F1 ATP synthase subunit A [Rhizobacter sp.]|nr:F0F1 ATP synthase subunit A [Chlorobiales bacterium]